LFERRRTILPGTLSGKIGSSDARKFKQKGENRMGNLLQELYNGSVTPAYAKVLNDAEGHALIRKTCEEEADFKEILSSDGSRRLEAYVFLRDEREHRVGENAFALGFQTAVQFLTEAQRTKITLPDGSGLQ
jgi:hypothetical protein